MLAAVRVNGTRREREAGPTLLRRLLRALGPPAPLELYCDGSAGERVGTPGGWAFLVVRGDEVLASGHGAAARTTSLVMELEAARAALHEVLARGWHRRHAVQLVTDSAIALDVAAGRFVPRRHEALARALRAAAVEAGAATRWVRAHSGHRWNDAVDALAHEAKVRRQAPGGG